MKFKSVFIMLALALCLLLISACRTNDTVIDETYPDVAGTWDWIVNFTQNGCDGGAGYNVILVITQDEGTGTWTSYDNSDTNLTCPLETGIYNMDINGNVSIDLSNYQFDPQGCNNDTPPDARVTIHITALATSTHIDGTQTEYWTSVAMGVTDCKKEGNVTADKR
jgi:hypothetical protein